MDMGSEVLLCRGLDIDLKGICEGWVSNWGESLVCHGHEMSVLFNGVTNSIEISYVSIFMRGNLGGIICI